MLVLVGDETKSPVQGWRYVSVGFSQPSSPPHVPQGFQSVLCLGWRGKLKRLVTS